MGCDSPPLREGQGVGLFSLEGQGVGLSGVGLYSLFNCTVK